MKIWVNGTFDVLHIGHIRMLEYAASLGQLMVAVDSDERVRKLKGSSRPFNKVEDRIEFLASLRCVDIVTKFTTDEQMITLMKNWKTDIMVKGADWKGKPIVGEDVVKEIRYFDIVEGKSTTNILSYYTR